MKKEKTVILGVLIVAMILPVSSIGMVEAQTATEQQLHSWAKESAKLQLAISEGDSSESSEARLSIVLDNLNNNGVTMQGQEIHVLSEYHFDGVDEISSVKKCGSCAHSMKVRAAYEYFKYHLLGFNFYGHEKGPWSTKMVSVSNEGTSQIQVKQPHVNTPIRAYSIDASDDRPTTVIYNVQLSALNDNDDHQFPSRTIDFSDLTATFSFAWDTHNSPKTVPFTPTDNWLITLVGELDAIS